MPQGQSEARYYRVVGTCAPGGVKKDGQEAWDSFWRLNSGVDESERGSFVAQTSAILMAADTRRAVMAADVSKASGGAGNGHWWRAWHNRQN